LQAHCQSHTSQLTFQSFAKELASQRTKKRQENCHPDNKKLKDWLFTK
jgi:hypothetical protein